MVVEFEDAESAAKARRHKWDKDATWTVKVAYPSVARDPKYTQLYPGTSF